MLSLLKCNLCLFQNIKSYTKISKDDIKMLTAYFPKMDGKQLKGKICNFCKKNLIRRHDFKVKCLNVEQKVSDIVKMLATEQKINILDVIGLDTDTIPEILACRLCLKVIRNQGHFSLFRDNKSDKYKWAIKIIKKCFPEINLASTERPMLCNNCWSEVENSNRFVDMCLQNHVEIFMINHEVFSEDEDEDTYDDDENMFPRIRSEMMLQEDNDSRESFNGDINFFIKTEVMEFLELNYNNTELSPAKNDLITENRLELPPQDEDEDTNKTNNVKLKTRITNKKPKSFECKQCSYKGKTRRLFRRHLLEHERAKQNKLFKCTFCKYKTPRKGNLKIHMLVHAKRPKLFKCPSCQFQTKWKYYLKSHVALCKSSNLKWSKRCNNRRKLTR